MVPTMIMATVMKRVSWFLIWPISWAITPCSSSRLSRWRSPVVTATAALSGLSPVAKALGAGLSMMCTSGIRGRPEAMDISSTMFQSWGASTLLIFLALEVASTTLSPAAKAKPSCPPQSSSAARAPRPPPTTRLGWIR